MGGYKTNSSSLKKEAILTFVQEHGRRPSPRNPEERKLAWAAGHYSRPSGNCYDPEFSRRLKDLSPTRVKVSASLNKTEILAFCKEHCRRPSRKKPGEKKLADGAKNYTHPSSVSYDPEFTRRLDELVPRIDTVSLNKEAILAFVNEHGRRPLRTRPEEKKLAIVAESYTSPSGGCYDQEFAGLLNELVPRIYTPGLNKEAILAFIKEHGRRPSQFKPDEKVLGQAMSRYARLNSDCYDPEFAMRLNELAPKIDTVSLKKEAILAFVKEHGRRPIRTKPEERFLEQAAGRYTSPNSDSYDPEFTRRLNELVPIHEKKFNPTLKKEAILAFVKEHGRKPSTGRPKEKRLREAANSYTSTSSGSYDAEFARQINELVPRLDTVAINKKKILYFAKTHGRRPSTKKPSEKSLGSAASNYTRPKHRSYDPEFAKKLNELAPKKDPATKKASLNKEASLAFVNEHGRKSRIAKSNGGPSNRQV